MPANDKLTHPNLPLIGGVMAAIGAGLCCVGPFVLLTLGISGAWIGNLTLLEPYRPIFIAIVLLFFGWARNVNKFSSSAATRPALARPQLSPNKSRDVLH